MASGKLILHKNQKIGTLKTTFMTIRTRTILIKKIKYIINNQLCVDK